MDHSPEQKEILHRYLRKHRAALLAKLDGLTEQQVRWPLTRTGTNLLGLVKHVASVQVEYFGLVFDRQADRVVPWLLDDAEEGSDMFATEDERIEDIVTFHHWSAEHADATIDALDLDAPGVVPWWSEADRNVTLHRVLVHMGVETARHAGQADIVREMLDGAAGDGDGNLQERSSDEWREYRERLERIARGAGSNA